MAERKMRKRKFDGKEYYLYGKGDNRRTAKAVGKSVREAGGLARVVGLEIWVRKTKVWK